MMLLEVNNLSVAYGQVVAVHDLNFSLKAGESLSLLGANGAGKTSTVEAISGFLKTTAGNIVFDGKNISSRPASHIARSGLALVPQWRELFPNFTVEETLIAGRAAARNREPLVLDEIYDYFPALAERRGQLAGSLSGGEQQMLAVGRALIGRPKTLLIDEPSAGLAVGVVRYLIEIIARIRDTGVALLLVEQNLEIARALTSQCIVLSVGRAVWRGTISETKDLDDIRQAYFL
jgi:branched-chain amino acid transport system ATP-binding protein